jgi:hypothetical protein
MDFDRRGFLTATAAVMVPPFGHAAALPLRPEDFGARGDGATNDTAAFARLSAEVNRRGGGTIELRPDRTYVVGDQSLTRAGWSPQPILELKRLTAPLAILGNGARLLAQAGLRFGTFDMGTGKAIHHPMPYLGPGRADAYLGMIVVRDCTAPITIRDVELDGNMAALKLGGEYGDTGWQLSGTGLLLIRNLAAETVENVHSHHHGQDGAMFIGSGKRTGRGTVRRLISRYNGRQGLSITGGKGYDLIDCEFAHSARLRVKSAPSAGVDIEAEDEPLRDISFTRCSFIDNAGCGLVADSGDSRNLRFDDCRFVGSTSWSAWPNKPGCSFAGCTFVGSVVHAYPDPDPRRAARFTSCTFTDDPQLSPTGKVFTPDGPIVNLAESQNVLFDRCRFRLVGSGTLPWSWKAIYRDCTMSQKSKKVANCKGRYLGRTTISGPVDLYGSMIEGTVVLNGRAVPHGPLGVRPW